MSCPQRFFFFFSSCTFVLTVGNENSYTGQGRERRELIKFALLSLDARIHIWDGLSERTSERNVRVMIVSLLVEKKRRKSNGYLDKCVHSTSYATLGGMSDHHYVFLCYLTD